MSKLNRRNVLKGGVGIGAGMLLTNPLNAFSDKGTKKFSTANVEDAYASIVKHGRPKGDNIMVWSLAKVANPAAIDRVVEELRSNHRYRTRIKYSSNDKFKVRICTELIDYVVKSRDIAFKLIVFENYNSITKGLAPKEFQQRMLNAYNKLTMGGIRQVDIKAEDNFGPSEEFRSNVENLSGYSIKTATTRDSNLMQLNDLISGLFYALLSGRKIHGETKNTLIKHFKSQYEIRDERPRRGDYGNISVDFAQL